MKDSLPEDFSMERAAQDCMQLPAVRGPQVFGNLSRLIKPDGLFN